MPRGHGRYVVIFGGDDESVRMHLRIMMMMRIAILIGGLPWVFELAPCMPQRGGVDVGAEFMRPQVQHSRHSH